MKHSFNGVHRGKQAVHAENAVCVVRVIVNRIQCIAEIAHHRIGGSAFLAVNIDPGDVAGSAHFQRIPVRDNDCSVIRTRVRHRTHDRIVFLADSNDCVLVAVEKNSRSEDLLSPQAIVDEGVVHNADIGIAAHIRRAQRLPALDHIVVLEINCALAVNGNLVIHLAVRDRGGHNRHRRIDRLHARNVFERLQIRLGESGLQRCSRSAHGNGSGAEPGEFIHNGVRDSLNDRDQGDDRSHTDDNAEHGEERPHLVRPYVLYGHFEALSE